MSNEVKTTIEPEEVTEVAVVKEESKFKKAMSTVGHGIKKHKKAVIAVGATVLGVVLFGVLRNKFSNNDGYESDDIYDDDLVEVDVDMDDEIEEI